MEVLIVLHEQFDNTCSDQHGAARADVHTVATSSRLDAIKSVYGVSVAHNLLKVEARDNDPSSSIFEMNGFISNSSYSAKKITMVLFINGLYDFLLCWLSKQAHVTELISIIHGKFVR